MNIKQEKKKNLLSLLQKELEGLAVLDFLIMPQDMGAM